MATERQFQYPDPDLAIFHDDFFNYVAGDWTVTTTEAGAGSATEAISDAAHGVLLLTNAAGDNDNDFLQRVGTAAESFSFVSGKRLMFRARFQVSDATESDFVIGLQITDTSPLAVTDGIYFRKDDGDALLDFVIIKDSTATTVTGAGTVADDTWMVVEFHYDGSGTMDYYIDNVLLGSAAITNVPDDEELTVSFGIQNGEAVAKTMSIDYVTVVQER